MQVQSYVVVLLIQPYCFFAVLAAVAVVVT